MAFVQMRTWEEKSDDGRKVKEKERSVCVPDGEIAIYTLFFLTCQCVSRVQRVTKIFALAALTTQNSKVRCLSFLRQINLKITYMLVLALLLFHCSLSLSLSTMQHVVQQECALSNDNKTHFCQSIVRLGDKRVFAVMFMVDDAMLA